MDAAHDGEADEARCNAPNLGACFLQSFPGDSWSSWALRDSGAWEYRGRPVAQLRVLRVRGLRLQSTWAELGALQRCRARPARNPRRVTPSRVASSLWRRETGVGSGSVNGLLATESKGRESGRPTSG